jgi:tetratricopeptide (TPR) repeat protein
MWGLIELDKLAYAASLTPFVPAGVKEHPREEVFNILKNDPDPYERFKEIAEAAIAKNEKLAEPWESLRKLILPKRSEKGRLMLSKAYRELDEKKKALFYAVLALEEALGVYRSALRKLEEAFGVCGKDVEECEKVMWIVEVGEEPFKQVVYVADVGRLAQLAKEGEEAFEEALSTLRERLNRYAVKHGLRDLLDVNEKAARRLAEAKQPELSRFSGVNFGTKVYAALIAYREYALGRGAPLARRLGIGLRWVGRLGSSTTRRKRRTTRPRKRERRSPRLWRSWWQRASAASS